ncbi:UNVERIFIED_ORG: hypothetical protein JN05_05142 [Zoogloea ramigera]|uniref:Uncharacterized protein n=1 Tax=Duganella zoogloeoides TaxID=75659 RepID=A0ABZ0Y082_9BURK|nr:hypothetical protein [Duganella zoogloeoides]WQH05289.1 hypothetical protein SR858_02855 [Duganella zoogloeoides]
MAVLKKTALAVMAWSLCAGALAQQQALPATWSLRLPPQQAVAFRGLANFDKSGKGASGTTYMMPGIAGLAAAVAAHSLVINRDLEQQKSAIELAADKVLLPYRPVLDAMRHDTLMAQALARVAPDSAALLLAFQDQDQQGWLVESTPLFAMTQDQSALVLDNAIAVYAPGARQQAAYRNTVRVVSRASTHADLETYWNAAQGRQLQDASAALLALSLEIALRQAHGGAAAPADRAGFRTVRYHEGRKEVAERAQVLSEQCGRALISNLRGWLMSVPLPQSGADPACAEVP